MRNSRYHYDPNHQYVYDPNDGRPANWLRICKCCNAKIPGGAQFCRHCGTPTKRPITERYRNRVATGALILILGVLLMSQLIVKDTFLNFITTLTFLCMSAVAVVSMIKNSRRQP